jgi:hypothetical protein
MLLFPSLGIQVKMDLKAAKRFDFGLNDVA